MDHTEYDCGDKRTTGYLEVHATLNDGKKLQVKGFIGSEGGLMEEETVMAQRLKKNYYHETK